VEEEEEEAGVESMWGEEDEEVEDEEAVAVTADGTDAGADVEGAALRKRQRILQLATQLACESEEGERRDALIQQLMRVTKGDSTSAGAVHFKPFSQWELHDGSSSDGSVKTEALHSPTGTLERDLERGVDDLIAAASSRVSSGSERPPQRPPPRPRTASSSTSNWSTAAPRSRCRATSW